MIRLETIENWLNSDDFNREQYAKRIYKFLNNVYDALVNDKELMDVVKCKYNDKQDVLNYFLGKLDDAILQVTDFDNSREFELYNVMCDDKNFYKRWSRDLFSFVYDKFYPKSNNLKSNNLT